MHPEGAPERTQEIRHDMKWPYPKQNLESSYTEAIMQRAILQKRNVNCCDQHAGNNLAIDMGGSIRGSAGRYANSLSPCSGTSNGQGGGSGGSPADSPSPCFG